MAEKIADKLKQEAIARKYQLVEADRDMTFGQLAAQFMAEGGATAVAIAKGE